MSFKTDVDATPSLNGKYCSGLKALPAVDSARVSVNKPRDIEGSVDIDSALKQSEPNATRWDYVIAHKSRLIYLEVHPASSTKNAGEVREKLDWLRSWLKRKNNKLSSYQNQFVWISSGPVTFTPTDPRIKALASAGLLFAGGHYKFK